MKVPQGILSLSCFIILCYQYRRAEGGQFITDDSYVYQLNFTNGTVCMTFSLKAQIVLFYKSINNSNITHPVIDLQQVEFELPNKTVTTSSHDCSDPKERTLTLAWPVGGGENMSLFFNFSLEADSWYLAEVDVDFDLVNGSVFDSPAVPGLKSFRTKPGVKFFNRTFHTNNYFYCKYCKKLLLLENTDNDTSQEDGPCPTVEQHERNTTSCSYVDISNSVIYPGKLDSSQKKKLCLEDFIELQEIIIPSAVGGALVLLLVVVFAAYLIAFIRRKRREGRYETLNEGY